MPTCGDSEESTPHAGGRRARSATLLVVLAWLFAGSAQAQGEPAHPADAGRAAEDGADLTDDPPPEVYDRVKGGITEFCPGLSKQGIADFYVVTYQAHRLFAERSGLPEQARKARYTAYMAALCMRLRMPHADVGKAHPYRAVELLMVDITTELCHLEDAVAKEPLAAALRQAGGDARLQVVSAFCKEMAIFSRKNAAVRRSFAAASLSQLCLDPSAAPSDPRFKALPTERVDDAVALCERRASGPVDDVAAVIELWSPPGAEEAPSEQARVAADDGASTGEGGASAYAVPVAVVAALCLVVAWAVRRRS